MIGIRHFRDVTVHLRRLVLLLNVFHSFRVVKLSLSPSQNIGNHSESLLECFRPYSSIDSLNSIRRRIPIR